MTQFTDIGITEAFEGYFKEMKFSSPSEVQRRAIEARFVLILSFLIPMRAMVVSKYYFCGQDQSLFKV